MEPMGAPASQLILMKTLVYNHFPFFFFFRFQKLNLVFENIGKK